MNKGYTLIEVMVALAVFAILATITSSALYHAFNTRARVNSQADQLNTLQLALAVIERDTEQMVARTIRGNEMRTFPAFVGQPHYSEFTRDGFVNPDNSERRSTLQRVAYLCAGKQLIRRSWESLDLPARNHYQNKTLLDNLDKCTIAYLARNNQVLTEWREQNQKGEALPLAIQLTITVQGMGNMSLLYGIPEAIYAR